MVFLNKFLNFGIHTNTLLYTNINGKLQPSADATIAADNRAFRYGYGLFETLLCIEGQLQLKEYHWQRLFEGMQQLYFDLPKLFTPAFLEEEVNKTIARNGLQKLCRVRLQVYANGGGLYDGHSAHPEFVVECFPIEPHILQLNETGLVLGICSDLKKSNDKLANIKSCNALIYAIAAKEAKTQKWNDALICNSAGNIIESTIANIFWIKDKQLYTPPLSEGCVAGVMRRHILNNFEVKESTLSTQILHNADELFLTNAIRRIKWVKAMQNTSYALDILTAIYSKLFL